MLDGTQFNLAARKGRIQVLDFWATWCGPCMQTMPLVDEVVRSFRRQTGGPGRGQSRRAAAHQIDARASQAQGPGRPRPRWRRCQVRGDSDPANCCDGPEGKIVRLFVGGGKNTADALQSARGANGDQDRSRKAQVRRGPSCSILTWQIQIPRPAAFNPSTADFVEVPASAGAFLIGLHQAISLRPRNSDSNIIRTGYLTAF